MSPKLSAVPRKLQRTGLARGATRIEAAVTALVLTDATSRDRRFLTAWGQLAESRARGCSIVGSGRSATPSAGYDDFFVEDSRDPAVLNRRLRELGDRPVLVYVAVAPEDQEDVLRALAVACTDIDAPTIRVVTERAVPSSWKRLPDDRERSPHVEYFAIDDYVVGAALQRFHRFQERHPEAFSDWGRETVDHVQLQLTTRSPGDAASSSAGVLSGASFSYALGVVDAIVGDRLRPPSLVPSRGLSQLVPPRETEIVVGRAGSEAEVAAARLPAAAGKADTAGADAFVALRAEFDIPSWHSVPFYLRIGHGLARETAQLTVCFRGRRRRWQSFPLEQLETGERDYRLLLEYITGGLAPTGMAAVLEQRERINQSLPRLSVQRAHYPNYVFGSSGPAAASTLLEREGRRWRVMRATTEDER